MKLTSQIILVYIILLTGAMNAFSQKKDKISDPKLGKALKEYKSLHYVAAINELNQVVKKDSNNITALELMANSYRNIRNYDKALFWYQKLSLQPDLKPLNVLNYAEALANKEHYEESEQWFRKYLVMVPADKRAVAFAKDGVPVFQVGNTDWKVSFTDLNTVASEYAPLYYKDGLLFVSNRLKETPVKSVFGWDQTPYTNFYQVDKLESIKTINPDTIGKGTKNKSHRYKYNDDDTAPTSNDNRVLGEYNYAILKDSLGAIVSLNRQVHSFNKNLNTKFHEGPAVVFPDGSLMFTRNNYYQGKAVLSQDGSLRLKMYTASGYNLSDVSEFIYNNNEYSVGHPAINKDGTILIFSSDMPGGYGGTDLYFCVRSSANGVWGRPINLGSKINTEGNEMFPYVAANGHLFFSSTGHPGYGGLDIFEITLQDMKAVGKPANLGVPFNSPADDFGIIKSKDDRSGFFASNRRGNDDIYKFERLSYRVSIQGLVTDASTRLPIFGSQIILRRGDDADTLKTTRKGDFLWPLEKQTDYDIIVSKPGYLTTHTFLSTNGITADSVIKMEFKLTPPLENQRLILKNCDSLKRVFGVNKIYYDLDKSAIRSDAIPALEKMVKLLQTYPDLTVISASHCDSRASYDYNKRLSLRRGQAAKNYLVAKGIDASRIRVEYYGKSRLTNQCYDGVPCSETEQQMNRRTEFEIVLNNVNLNQSCPIN